MNVENGLWDCKFCQLTGNIQTFLDKLCSHYLETTTKEDYARLRMLRRKSTTTSAFKHFRFAWDGKRWLFPTLTDSGNLQDLRIYVEGRGIEATKGCHTGLWGLERLAKLKKGSTVIVCEGEWDGVSLWDLLQNIDGGDDFTVVAVPGANQFKDEWIPWFAGMNVILAYDADGSGDTGMETATGKLRGIAKSINYVRWSLEAPTGFDISDLIVVAADYDEAWKTFKSLLNKAPRTKPTDKTEIVLASGGKANPDLKLASWHEVRSAYAKWLRLNEDNFDCLRYAFATVLAPRMKGGPTPWSYIVAAAGKGKTAMINPFRSATNDCIFRSTLTKESLISGYDKSKGKDPGLFAELDGESMCLVLKDMTEVFALPEAKQEELFGTLRGSFDGNADRNYGNDVYRKYDDLNFSILAGVTPVVHGYNKSNLGERMIKYQMVRYGQEETLQDEHAVLRQALRNVGHEQQKDEELSEVVVRFLLNEFDPIKLKALIPQKYEDKLCNLSSMIVRFRQSVQRERFKPDEISYKPLLESPARVGQQLMKLMVMLMVTSEDGKTFGDKEMRIIERVSFDTSIGWNIDVFETLVRAGGLERPVSIAEMVAIDDYSNKVSLGRRLDDMVITNLLVKERVTGKAANKSSKFFSATPILSQLWLDSMIEGEHRDRIMQALERRKRPVSVQVPNTPSIRYVIKKKAGK